MTSKVHRIEISRAFQSLGSFKPEEVKSGFETGQFKSGDYGRYEDSGEWRPVEVVVGELKKPTPARQAKPADPKPAAKPKKKSEECCCCCVTADVKADTDSSFVESIGSDESVTRKGIKGFLREILARF